MCAVPECDPCVFHTKNVNLGGKDSAFRRRRQARPYGCTVGDRFTDTGRILAPRCTEVGGFEEVEHAGVVVLLAIAYGYWEDIGAEM